MKKTFCLVLISLFVGCLAVSGCGGGSDDAGSTDRSAADAGGQMSGVGVPLPPSADAVSTTESGPLTVVQFIVPLNEQEATISFYDDWTDSQAEAYLRTEAGSGGVGWQNDPEGDSEKIIINVLSPLEGDEFVTVTVSAGALG